MVITSSLFNAFLTPEAVKFGLSMGFWFFVAYISCLEVYRWWRKRELPTLQEELQTIKLHTAREMVDLIVEILDEDEGRSLTIYSGNADFNDQPSYVIELEYIDWASKNMAMKKRAWSGEHRVDILRSIKADLAHSEPVCYHPEDEDNLLDSSN